MENEFYFTDNNGQRIEDFNKYFDENPEMLQKQIEILNQRRKIGLSDNPFDPATIKEQVEVSEVGVFRKYFKEFYYFCLKDIQNNSKNKTFLLEKIEFAQNLIDESNIEIRYRPENIRIIENLNFVIAVMQALQNRINIELSRLERENGKDGKMDIETDKRKKRAVSVCVGNVEMNKPTFEKMLPKMNELFFDNSIIDQWECIIKNANPTPPIKIKKNTSLIDLRLFFDLLSENEIFESGYLTPLIKLNAFFLTDPKHNKILEYDQLTQAKKEINKKNIKPKFTIDSFLA